MKTLVVDAVEFLRYHNEDRKFLVMLGKMTSLSWKCCCSRRHNGTMSYIHGRTSPLGRGQIVGYEHAPQQHVVIDLAELGTQKSETPARPWIFVSSTGWQELRSTDIRPLTKL